ncbi:MAG TPA: winged helix-turn-helix domain-containing protein [Candidatus Dormibacteraeota bacterium]|nr:winged helix-turn-helix domain-containing protein [Candidatus Dormibacteraeota bacterium]
MKSFESFQLDTKNLCLLRGDERVAITPKAFDVLRYLVENSGRLVTPDELLQALWPETYVNPEVLRKYILEIRKALQDRADQPTFIETVTKRGYRFIAAVRDEGASELPTVPHCSEANERLIPVSDAAAAEQEHRLPRVRIPGLMIPAVVVMALAVAVLAYLWRAQGRTKIHTPSDTSIAVLPFSDMSPQQDQEYFSDGLTEELITRLTKIPGLKVVGRSSAFQFKGKNEDIRLVGQKLGVMSILEGSVRIDGNHVRITAALVKADDGFELWSESYDRELSNIFNAQDEIARAVTEALRLKLHNTDRATQASSQTNPEAYEAYLQAQYSSARGQDKHDLNRALAYSEQAIQADPKYAPAWAQRSRVLETLARVALIESNEGFRRARESAERAIALDPTLATGYLALSQVQIDHDWDWQGAEISLQKAASLAPGSVGVLDHRAYLARTLGHVDEAIELYKQVIALDPLRANFHLSLGYQLFLAGRYDEAEAALSKAQELNPQLSSLHLTRGKILLWQGRPQEALAEIEKETGEWEKLSGESLAYYALGRIPDADRALGRLIATYQNDAAYQVAEVYAYRGMTEEAFAWLERAYRQRDPGAPELGASPLMKNLHQDPRFAELVKRMHVSGSTVQLNLGRWMNAHLTIARP